MFSEITAKTKELFEKMKNIPSLQSVDTDALMSLAVVLVITILSYETTDLFYKAVSFPLTKHAAVTKNHGSASLTYDRQQHQLQEYGIITERNLFLTTMKTAGGDESAEGLFAADAKSIDFDLKGTIAGNSSFGFIIVEERGSRKQKLYRLGDKIGSRKLSRITRNTAVLEGADGEVTLKVKETLEDSLMSSSPGVPRRPQSPGTANLIKNNIGGKSNYLDSIMKQAVVRPFMHRGVREGYIISNIKPDSLYEKAGFQNGDIITEVNNNQMQNANDLMQLFSSMQSGSRLAFGIKRRGKAETLNYTLE